MGKKGMGDDWEGVTAQPPVWVKPSGSFSSLNNSAMGGTCLGGKGEREVPTIKN